MDVEPEAIREEDQRQQSAEARRRWGVLRAEELARKESKSRRERLRKVEARARQKNIGVYRHLAAIDREIRTMEQLVGT